MPLADQLKYIIENASESLSEYQLLSQLKSHPIFTAIEKTCQQQPQLLLFRKHFTLMNALYQLQSTFWKQQRLLEISALKITLQPVESSNSDTAISVNCSEGLRSYYLDWDNYLNTNCADVDSLLGDFWLKFSKLDRRQAALELFELDSTASASEITQRYRKLINTHHPDKGGDSEIFIQIREAREILK